MQVPRDSRVTLDWIQRACTHNPVKKLVDPQTGKFEGNYSTGPVRLTWTQHLFKPQTGDSGNDKYSVTPLWPPGVDLTPLIVAANEAGYAGYPDHMTSQGFQWAGLQSPWHDQLEKAGKYKGYTPGAWYVNAGTYFPPRIVDPHMNDIVEEKRVYPGVWAILAINAYPYGHKPMAGRPTKKGVSFGLQSTVIIGDDDILGGGGLDPKKAFQGLNIANTTNIAASFAASGPIMPPTSSPSSVPNSMDELRRLGLI